MAPRNFKKLRLDTASAITDRFKNLSRVSKPPSKPTSTPTARTPCRKLTSPRAYK